MADLDRETGKSRLPWFQHIFAENGTVFENFYTRGISLSAPSWSMLDTGRHGIIRGNVEYDRYSGHVYDYLNFVPNYLGSARLREVDMPAAEELDRAGIPLLVDFFPGDRHFQGFQLFQRGIRLKSLQKMLEHRLSSKILVPMLENAGAPSYDQTLEQQMEIEFDAALQRQDTMYADLYTGDIDHIGHALNRQDALLDALRRVDALAGRMWRNIQSSPLGADTVFVVVSDHGMNNQPGIFSQAFSLTDLFASAAGGAHHVVTNRQQLSDYTLKSLNPLTQRVITPSTASFYLAGESQAYPTAWFDLDGNERASVHLRNNTLNEIHILLQQLSKEDLPPRSRAAIATALNSVLDRNRERWRAELTTINSMLAALQKAIDKRRIELMNSPKQSSDDDSYNQALRRLRLAQEDRIREHAEYTAYRDHLQSLLQFKADGDRPFKGKLRELVPPLALGDRNTFDDLRNYIVGPAASGMQLDPRTGLLDESQSFRRVNYFHLLSRAKVRNNPQRALTDKPVDFTALALGDGKYWVYSSDEDQLLISTNSSGTICVEPISSLRLPADGPIAYSEQAWRAGLPLHLFEDDNLRVPPREERAAWLSAPHSEAEWMNATHRCRYSNAVIGLIEDLSPVASNVPGAPDMDAALLEYERWRRERVQPDLMIFAADHWNFNVRNFNPGGNHGSFFRISTHSVWMMAGAGVPVAKVEEPCDSLNFASTILNAVGKPAPMPDRVIRLSTQVQ